MFSRTKEYTLCFGTYVGVNPVDLLIEFIKLQNKYNFTIIETKCTSGYECHITIKCNKNEYVEIFLHFLDKIKTNIVYYKF